MPYFTIVGTSRLTGEKKVVRGVKAKDSHQAVNQSRSQFDGLYWHFYIRLSKLCHRKPPTARTIRHLSNTQRRSVWAVLTVHHNQRSKADIRGDSGFRSLIKELQFHELLLLSWKPRTFLPGRSLAFHSPSYDAQKVNWSKPLNTSS
jgi:hypothetical protein